MHTVAELFRCLEEQNFQYAVLRNYEYYPDLRGGGRTRNTDIDLVVRNQELPRLREMLARLAADCGWDLLTECGHYARSGVRHHQIQVFQFYRMSPVEYLQVDIFHAYLVWGLPFMDEQELLSGRQHDPVRGLTHIDPLKEQAYRLVQVDGLGDSERTAAKRVRYRGKIEAFREGHEQEYREYLQRSLGPSGIEAAEALRAGDSDRFHRAVHAGKRRFFLRHALTHPWALVEAYERRREAELRVCTDPCGCSLAVNADTAGARSRFSEAMELLAGINAIDEWAEKSWSRAESDREQEILEQGGLLIEWGHPDRSAVVIEPGDTRDEIATKVLKACVYRHHKLYERPKTVHAGTPVRVPEAVRL